MALWQGKSKRKHTGGKRIYSRKKRAFEIGAEKQFTIIGLPRKKVTRVRSQHSKVRLMGADIANVLDTKTNKAQRSKILSVLENPADPHFIQRNIITKGALIKTEAGNARVTSRPGQVGTIDAILVE